MPSKEDIIAWKTDAQRTLERAQQLSSRANDNLLGASNILRKQLLEKLNEANSQAVAARRKHSQIVVQVEDLKRLSAEYTSSHDLLVEKELEPALFRFDAVLKSLEEIEVPSFLTPSEEGHEQRLSDFVSWPELDLLRVNIAAHQKNCKKALLCMNKETLKLKEKLHTGTAMHSTILKLYDSRVAEVKLLMNEAVNKSPPKNGSNPIYTLLKENISLENELASILKMLTNHFDQCCLAAQWNSTADVESLTVLQEDSNELPSVLKEVEAIYEIIDNNCARANQFVEQKMPAINDVINQCQKWQKWCDSFINDDIVEFLLLFLACKQITLLSSIDQEPGKKNDPITDNTASVRNTLQNSPIYSYIEVLDQLCHHYEQFKIVYKTKYLTELHHEQFVYPREFLRELDTYLNVKLLKFDSQERERRRAWLQKYGDYIPRQFYLPGELNQPQVVQVLSEGLEDIQSAATKENEMRLLALIKKLKV